MTLMGGSVLLDSWVSIVALMAFYGGEGRREKNIKGLAAAGGFFFFASFGRRGAFPYLEEFKEHVVQVRGDVGDLDGLSDLVGCTGGDKSK